MSRRIVAAALLAFAACTPREESVTAPPSASAPSRSQAAPKPAAAPRPSVMVPSVPVSASTPPNAPAPPGASARPTPTPPEPRTWSSEFQGFLGVRPVRATLHFVGVGIPDVGEDPFEFSGTLRFLGTATRSLSGRSGSQGTSDWEGVRRSECAVDLVAPKDGAPLTKIEGACAIANGHFEGFAGTAHEPDGTRGEWLALRALHDAAVFDRYHRALLKTPRSETGCPPLIDIHDVVKSEAEPTRIVYRIGFPCVGEVEHITQQAISIAGPVYLATIDEAEPTRLVSSGTLTKESEPAETFDLERLRWDTNSYALRLARHHQQHKVGVLRQSLWLLRADGRLGPELTLPERDDMSIPIACANDTHSRTAHVVDLDGRPPLDLLLRHVQKSVRAGTLPGESPDRCYDLPDKVAFVAYVTDPKTLRLQPAPLPGKEKSEALVAAHPPIAALSDTWSSLSGASPP